MIINCFKYTFNAVYIFCQDHCQESSGVSRLAHPADVSCTSITNGSTQLSVGLSAVPVSTWRLWNLRDESPNWTKSKRLSKYWTPLFLVHYIPTSLLVLLLLRPLSLMPWICLGARPKVQVSSTLSHHVPWSVVVAHSRRGRRPHSGVWPSFNIQLENIYETFNLRHFPLFHHK